MSDKIKQFIKSLYEIWKQDDGVACVSFATSFRILDLIPNRKNNALLYLCFAGQDPYKDLIIEISEVLSLIKEDMPPVSENELYQSTVREKMLYYTFLYLYEIYYELRAFSEREEEKLDSLIQSLIGEVEKSLKKITDNYTTLKTGKEVIREENKLLIFGYCCTSIVYNDLFDEFVEDYNRRHPDKPISREEFEEIAWSYSHIKTTGKVKYYNELPLELEDFEGFYYQPKNWTKEWQTIIKKNFPDV